MTEFVGRTGSKRVYSYPETRGTGPLPSAFARNSAFGPSGEGGTAITTAGTLIPWAAIEKGAAPGSTDIPITPAVTGIIRATGQVTIQNTSGAPVTCKVQIGFFGSSPYPEPNNQTVFVPANGGLSIPIMVDLLLGAGFVGSTIEVEVILTAGSNGALSLLASSSAIDLQEVNAPTA